jgi:DNA-directed RNA polymerase specialized sigma24 family protein
VDEHDLQQRLSRISTAWSDLVKAHGADADARTLAQYQLLQRYAGAVYRYLLGATRDPDVADELFQEFALGIVRGEFKHADPGRGRFRDYLRMSLSHLVGRHAKARKKGPQVAAGQLPEPVAPETQETDQAFLEGWRAELLARTWEALEQVERQTGQPFHTVLHTRASRPELSSAQLAAELSARLGKPLTAPGVRQTLHRAREKFAELLLDEVARSLQSPDPDRLGEELAELGLLSYCQDALQRRGGQP